MVCQEEYVIKGSARFRPNHFFAPVHLANFRSNHSAGLGISRVWNCLPHFVRGAVTSARTYVNVNISDFESSRITARLMFGLIPNRRGPVFWQRGVPDTPVFLCGRILLTDFLGRRFISRELLSNQIGFVHWANFLLAVSNAIKSSQFVPTAKTARAYIFIMLLSSWAGSPNSPSR